MCDIASVSPAFATLFVSRDLMLVKSDCSGVVAIFARIGLRSTYAMAAIIARSERNP